MNLYSICTVNGKIDPESAADSNARIIGHIVKFAAQRPELRGTPLRDFIDQLTMAMNVDQVKVFFNEYGQCVGYVIWAFLSTQVEQQFLQRGPRKLRPWEYSDGISLWILDLQVRPGSLPYVVDEFRNEMFFACEKITYFRKKNGKFVFRKFLRGRRISAEHNRG